MELYSPKGLLQRTDGGDCGGDGEVEVAVMAAGSRWVCDPPRPKVVVNPLVLAAGIFIL